MLWLERLGISQDALKTVWTVFLFLLAMVFLYEIRRALATFALAVFLAVLLSPLVSLVNRFTPARFPRTAALAVVYIVLLGTATAILIPIGSAVGEDAQALARKLPEAVQSNPLQRIPLPVWLEPARARLSEIVKTRVNEVAQDALPIIARAAGGVLTGLSTVISVVLIPILAFLFIKDGFEIKAGIVSSINERHRVLLANIFQDLRETLAQYLRALVIIASLTFAVFSGFLAITGAPYAVLLAGIAGLLEFIPAVGPFTAALAIIIVGLFSGYSNWVLLLTFLAVYRIALDYMLQPALMSAGVQLHPLLVIFAALAGGEIAGIPGAFFSIPLMAALRVIVRRLVHEV